MLLKLLAEKWRPVCLGLNVLQIKQARLITSYSFIFQIEFWFNNLSNSILFVETYPEFASLYGKYVS